MRTITGTAKYKDGTAAIGVNVRLAYANRQNVGNIGATTDLDGNWSMSFEPQSGLWIQATSNLSGAFWNQILRDNQTVYEIDFNEVRGTALLDEVVIIADSSATKCSKKGGVFNPTTKECKTKSNWALYAILGGVGLLALGLIIYGATRKK
mgnify:CR=1 FL=1|tara:strand:+ start:856 stop:1308 length:453 start_codon:yes stop_codon:yes gene_type:complete